MPQMIDRRAFKPFVIDLSKDLLWRDEEWVRVPQAKLRQIAPAQLAAYQNARTEAGRAPKTINGELSVLRQVLKRAKLWYRFDDEYTTFRNRKPPVGRALTAEEQSRLFEVARTNPAWLFACVAALSFYCGLRACEIKALRWQDVELANRLLRPPPAAWRAPTLNATCLSVLQELHATSSRLGFTQPTHLALVRTRSSG